MTIGIHRRHILAAVFACLLATIGLVGQDIPQDEIHWGSKPYAPQEPGAIRVRSNMVEVPVVVRNSHGQVVGGLKQGDFEVFDEGKPQKISFFSLENSPRMATEQAAMATQLENPAAAPVLSPPAPRPRYVALYFDDTSTPTGDLTFARKAAEQFIKESLEPGDKVGIFSSSTTVQLNFTDDKQKLLDTLGQLRTHQKRADDGAVSCPRIGPYQAYLILEAKFEHTQAFDLAVAEAQACGVCGSGAKSSGCTNLVTNQAQETLALTEHFSQDTLGILSDVIGFLAKMPGRRMLVLTSSGFLTQTLGPQQDKVIDAALHADVVINSLDAKGLCATPPGGDLSDGPPIVLTAHPELQAYRDRVLDMQKEVMNDPLALLAEGTGGHFFHNSNDLGRGFREMASAPDASYMLGFSPEDIKANGKFHGLKVKLVNGHDVTIEARRGYFATAPAAQQREDGLLAKRDKLDHAVLAADTITDIPAEVTAQSETLNNGQQGLQVAVHVDVHNLPFQRSNDRSVESLIYVTALFDSQDHFLAGVEGVMDLSFKDATLAQVSSQGLDAKLFLQAPAGPYRLREVVEEVGGGHLAALSRPVEIH